MYPPMKYFHVSKCSTSVGFLQTTLLMDNPDKLVYSRNFSIVVGLLSSIYVVVVSLSFCTF